MPANTDEIVGIIFPLIPDHVQRFFVGNRTIFVKFWTRRGPPARLRPGSKLFFYQSGGNKEVVGQARIKEMDMEPVDEVLSKYESKLFLSKDELGKYVGNRRAKPMLILVLEDVRKYANPLRLKKSVTMAGQYMSRSMYQALRTDGESN